jgi:hypothetical protein
MPASVVLMFVLAGVVGVAVGALAFWRDGRRYHQARQEVQDARAQLLRQPGGQHQAGPN